MPSPEAHRRLWSAAMFVLPVVAVKVAAALLGGSAPSAAKAGPVVGDPAAAVGDKTGAARIEWTASQHQAAEHVRELSSTPFGPAPMFYAAKPQMVVSQPQPEVAAPQPEAPVIPEFTLHAVMTASGDNKAVINGHLCRVGDKVGDTGWRVREIDIDRRKVTLSDGSKELVITVRGRS